MIDFDDKNTVYGLFYHDLKTWAPTEKDWWTKAHDDLGCSPFAALCDNRFGDVMNVLAAPSL